MSVEGQGFSVVFRGRNCGKRLDMWEKLPHQDQSLIDFMGVENYKKLSDEQIQNCRKLTQTLKVYY